MRRTMGWAATLLVSWLLAACATAEVSGHRVTNATAAVRLSSVEVVFLDVPSLKRTDLGGAFATQSSYAALSDRVALDVRRAMSEARDGVQAALAIHGIQGNAHLVSEQRSVPKPPSHQVVVSLVSAQANAQNTASITLQIAVLETVPRQLLWQGESKTFPGGDGFSKTAREEAIRKKQQRFGEGVVRALREAGL